MRNAAINNGKCSKKKLRNEATGNAAIKFAKCSKNHTENI